MRSYHIMVKGQHVHTLRAQNRDSAHKKAMRWITAQRLDGMVRASQVRVMRTSATLVREQVNSNTRSRFN